MIHHEKNIVTKANHELIFEQKKQKMRWYKVNSEHSNQFLKDVIDQGGGIISCNQDKMGLEEIFYKVRSKGHQNYA